MWNKSKDTRYKNKSVFLFLPICGTISCVCSKSIMEFVVHNHQLRWLNNVRTLEAKISNERFFFSGFFATKSFQKPYSSVAGNQSFEEQSKNSIHKFIDHLFLNFFLRHLNRFFLWIWSCLICLRKFFMAMWMHYKNRLTSSYWIGSFGFAKPFELKRILLSSSKRNRIKGKHSYWWTDSCCGICTFCRRLPFPFALARKNNNNKIEVYNGQKWKTILSKFEYWYPIIRIYPLCYCIDPTLWLPHAIANTKQESQQF